MFPITQTFHIPGHPSLHHHRHLPSPSPISQLTNHSFILSPKLTQSFSGSVSSDVTLGLFDRSLQTVVTHGTDVAFHIVGGVGDI